MSSELFWAGVALALVLEGLLPFISPGAWRRTFEQIIKLRDGQIRFFGMCSIAGGVLLLWLVA